LSSSPGDDAAELASISRSVRALVEWFDACGAIGVPAGEGRHAPLDEPLRSVPERRAAAAPPAEPTPRTGPAGQAPPARRREAAERAAKAVGGAMAPSIAKEPARTAARATPKLSAAEQELARQEALARLAVLEQEVKACTRCPLAQSRAKTVFARGNAQARLAFVGEGPGAEEDAQGLPFVGAAGQLLDRMIGAMGYRPEDVYICNVVKCRPPGNRKPEAAEMQACAGYLHEQLGLVEPDAIVALGATAVQGLLEWYDAGPYGPGITRLRGNWKLYRGRIPFMPTFHPAYLLRTPSKKRDVWSDLQAVMARLDKAPGSGSERGDAK
jgi:DNA polymerase